MKKIMIGFIIVSMTMCACLYGGTDAMVKLYKNENGKVKYWEIWKDKTTVVTHWGELGEEGENAQLKTGLFTNKSKIIEDKVNEKKKEGYLEIRKDEQIQIIIQFAIGKPPSEKDIEKRHAVEVLLNEVLGWTGNGMCDGADIGLDDGKINVFCYVVDGKVALRTLLAKFKEKEITGSFIVAERLMSDVDERITVIYPAGHKGEFEY